MARRARFAVVILLLVVLASAGAVAGPRAVHGLGIPGGYRVAYRSLAQGVDLFTLVARHRRVVHVVRVRRDAPYELRPLLSGERLSGPRPRLERTSEMCERARCLAAVNGDFFSGAGVPVGGMIAGGEPLRSSVSRPHLVLDADGVPHLRSGLALTGKLTVTYPLRVAGRRLPLEQVKTFSIDGVNAARGSGQIMAYTARFGPSTETRANGVELGLRLRARRLLAGVSQAAAITGIHRGRNTTVPSDGMVLSATGKSGRALEQLWRDVRSRAANPKVVLRLEAPAGGVEGIAGNPVILRDGRDAYPRSRAWFVHGLNPRTLVGWTRAGDMLLVAVDGRRPGYSSGMGLPEAAAMMRALGAVDALNLDGGGSTTMVVRGSVVNRPSDRLVRRNGRARVVRYGGGSLLRDWVERPVASALAIVARG